MRVYDEYKHYKEGDIYVYWGIAIPLLAEDCAFEVHQLTKVATAKFEHNQEPVAVYDYYGLPRSGGAGLLFIEAEEPYVIYQKEGSEGEENLWARRVDDFYGYVDDEGVSKKRFTLLEEKRMKRW